MKGLAKGRRIYKEVDKHFLQQRNRKPKYVITKNVTNAYFELLKKFSIRMMINE
jgi:hypothetical protein